MSPADPCAQERVQLTQQLIQTNSETYQHSVNKVRAECAEMDAQIEQACAENAAMQPAIDRAAAENAAMQPAIDRAAAENAAMQPAIDRAAAENAAMQPPIDQAVAANQSMPPGEAKNRHFGEVVNPLVYAKNRHFGEVVNPLVDAKNRHFSEVVSPLVDAKNRHWMEVVGPLINAKNQHWNQSVGQLNQDLQTRNQAVSDQVNSMDCSEVRKQLQQARQAPPAEPPAPTGSGRQESATPDPGMPRPIPALPVDKPPPTSPPMTPAPTQRPPEPPPISEEELAAAQTDDSTQPPATATPTDAATLDKPPDIPQGVLDILDEKPTPSAVPGPTEDDTIDREVKELIENKRFEGGYTREEVTQGVHAQRMAELMKELGKLDDPQKLLAEHDARIKTPEFQQLSKEEQISIEAGVWNRVHAQQRLDLARAPGNTIRQTSPDISETQVLHPDGTIYSRTECGEDSNERQVYENWVYADGTQVSRQKIESRQESSQDRSSYSEYALYVLSSDHTTCQVYATSVIENAESRGLPLPPAMGITQVDRQTIDDHIAGLQKQHRHGPWEEKENP